MILPQNFLLFYVATYSFLYGKDADAGKSAYPCCMFILSGNSFEEKWFSFMNVLKKTIDNNDVLLWKHIS
jgi:hypothetical protein